MLSDMPTKKYDDAIYNMATTRWVITVNHCDGTSFGGRSVVGGPMMCCDGLGWPMVRCDDPGWLRQSVFVGTSISRYDNLMGYSWPILCSRYYIYATALNFQIHDCLGLFCRSNHSNTSILIGINKYKFGIYLAIVDLDFDRS